MHYEDLSKYSYTSMKSRAALLNIGWLDPTVSHRTGSSPTDLVNRIATATPLLRNPMRGIQGCLFCRDEHIYVTLGGRPILLGMSEVWLPSPRREVIYISPSLLLHYVIHHNYLPPEEVIRELVELPNEEADWDTPQGSYRKLVKRYGD